MKKACCGNDDPADNPAWCADADWSDSVATSDGISDESSGDEKKGDGKGDKKKDGKDGKGKGDGKKSKGDRKTRRKFKKFMRKCDKEIDCDGTGPWQDCDEENKIGSTVCEYGIKNPDAGPWKQRCIMDEEKSVGEQTITCNWSKDNDEIRYKHQKNKCEMRCFTQEMEEKCADMREKLEDWEDFEEELEKANDRQCKGKKVKESHSFFSFLPFTFLN